jgi:hypothetical protein
MFTDYFVRFLSFPSKLISFHCKVVLCGGLCVPSMLCSHYTLSTSIVLDWLRLYIHESWGIASQFQTIPNNTHQAPQKLFTNPVINTSQTSRQTSQLGSPGRPNSNMSNDAHTSHSSSSSSRPSRFHEEMSYNMSNSRENDYISANHRLQYSCQVAGFEDFVHPSKLSTMEVEDERAERERAKMKEKAKGMVRGLSFKRT